MKIKNKPEDVFYLLVKVISVLFLMNFVVVSIRIVSGHDVMLGFIPLFDMDQEANIPTFFSALQLIAASFILLMISNIKRARDDRFILWLVLSVVFLFLGVDEFASIHERLTGPIRDTLGASGIFYFAWVVPYIVVVIIMFMVFFKFLISLPPVTRNLFVLSGFLYVSGAVGMELVGGVIAQKYGMQGWLYALEYSIEETLEMVAISIFIYANISYLVAANGDVSFEIHGQ